MNRVLKPVFVEHPPSVALVVLDADQLVLVRQTRAGAGGTTLELPSGKLEPGETPEQAAVRELAEECRLAAERWARIGSFWGAPSYSTEFVHVFEARDLSPAEIRPLDADEDIVVERRPVAGVLESLSDACSIAALALWERSTGGASPAPRA